MPLERFEAVAALALPSPADGDQPFPSCAERPLFDYARNRCRDICGGRAPSTPGCAEGMLLTIDELRSEIEVSTSIRAGVKRAVIDGAVGVMVLGIAGDRSWQEGYRAGQHRESLTDCPYTIGTSES